MGEGAGMVPIPMRGHTVVLYVKMYFVSLMDQLVSWETVEPVVKPKENHPPTFSFESQNSYLCRSPLRQISVALGSIIATTPVSLHPC